MVTRSRIDFSAALGPVFNNETQTLFEWGLAETSGAPFVPPPHGHGPPQPPPGKGGAGTRSVGYKLHQWRRENKENNVGLKQFLAWYPYSKPEVMEDTWHQPWSIPRTLQLRGIYSNKTPRIRGDNPVRTGIQQDFIPAGPKEIFVQGTWSSVEVNADVASFSVANAIVPPPAVDVSVSIREIPAIRRASAGVREDPLY